MNEHTYFAPLIIDSITTEHDVNVKSFNSGKGVANKDVKFEAKSPNHSLFHCSKKHK
jgi:hypothetical protein